MTHSSALLVIDFINDICHPEGKLSHSSTMIESHLTVEKANHAIAWAREHQIPIIAVKVGFSPNYCECPSQSPIFSQAPKFRALQLGAWGTDFLTDLALAPEDKVVIKHRISAFYNTDLTSVLSANQIDTLYISGVSTNMTVELTAREAHDRDYYVTIISDACAAADMQTHQSSLNHLSRLAQVITTDQLNN